MLNVFSDPAHLNAGLASDLVAWLEQGWEQDQPHLVLALSGGNSPQGLLARLVEKHSASRIWSQLEVYWVDERYVPFDHPESNFGNARSYLDSLGIPSTQLHPMTLHSDPETAAQHYQQELIDLEQARGLGGPLFDLTLLGIGPDGHLASLFPGTDHLHDQDYCKSSIRPETGQARITLTLPALNRSRSCIFLASGSAKAEIVARVMHGQPDPLYPASLLQANPKPSWYLDQQAAKLLT